MVYFNPKKCLWRWSPRSRFEQQNSKLLSFPLFSPKASRRDIFPLRAAHRCTWTCTWGRLRVHRRLLRPEERQADCARPSLVAVFLILFMSSHARSAKANEYNQTRAASYLLARIYRLLDIFLKAEFRVNGSYHSSLAENGPHVCYADCIWSSRRLLHVLHLLAPPLFHPSSRSFCSRSSVWYQAERKFCEEEILRCRNFKAVIRAPWPSREIENPFTHNS